MASYTHRSPRLLLVDDDPLFLEMVADHLSSREYLIDKAQDGIQAVDKIRSNHYDAIVLDLILPRVDGYTVCNLIKGDENLRRIPIIILSGVMLEGSDKIQEMQADAYIAKGAGGNVMSILEDTIERCLSTEPDAREGMKQVMQKPKEQLYARRSVAELLDLKDHLDLILSGMGEGVLEVGEDYRINLVNPALQKLLGQAGTALVGKEVYSLIPKQYQAAFRLMLERMAASPGNGPTVFSFKHEERMLRANFAPIWNDGVFRGAIAMFQDKTLEHEIDLRKTSFVVHVSHELRSPLSAIQSSARVLLDGMLGEVNEEQQEFLEIIHEKSQWLLRLINDILDVSKIESGGLELTLEPVDLKVIITQVVNGMQSLAWRKRQEIITDLDRPVPPARGNRDRLRQVLINLLGNAIKYTPVAGKVIISLEHDGSFVKGIVRDNGPGIPEDELEKIFTRFGQLEVEAHRGRKGMGLGLSICKSIVEAHGGRIWAQPVPEGGAQINFVVPVHRGWTT